MSGEDGMAVTQGTRAPAGLVAAVADGKVNKGFAVPQDTVAFQLGGPIAFGTMLFGGSPPLGDNRPGAPSM